VPDEESIFWQLRTVGERVSVGSQRETRQDDSLGSKHSAIEVAGHAADQGWGKAGALKRASKANLSPAEAFTACVN
jgi:hypothetical protein